MRNKLLNSKISNKSIVFRKKRWTSCYHINIFKIFKKIKTYFILKSNKNQDWKYEKFDNVLILKLL